MNRARLMIAFSALTGQKIQIASSSAPLDSRDSMVLDLRGEPQMVVEKHRLRLQRNVVYSTQTNAKGKPLALKLDIQTPLAPGRYPLVIYLPGGGFMVSPKQAALPQRTFVANHGFVVASIQYRTVKDGATYRDGVADVKAAIRYLRATADTHQIDPAKVGLWGESAGSYLAAMAGVTGGDPEFDSGSDTDVPAEVDAVVDLFGAADLSRLGEGFDTSTVAATTAPANFAAKYVFGRDTDLSVQDDATAISRANPVSYISESSPAFLLFHGIDDRVISPVGTQALHRALLEKNARSTRYLLEGAGHGDLSVNGSDPALWTTERVMSLIVEFLTAELAS